MFHGQILRAHRQVLHKYHGHGRHARFMDKSCMHTGKYLTWPGCTFHGHVLRVVRQKVSAAEDARMQAFTTLTQLRKEFDAMKASYDRERERLSMPQGTSTSQSCSSPDGAQHSICPLLMARLLLLLSIALKY
jgi:hypothetical protein